MGCSCKDNKENIEQGITTINTFRQLFINRMSVDSETHDARRKEFNKAIFFWNEEAGEYSATFSQTSMEMVLDKFDEALKDYRRTFCDVENCRRK